jgi:AsmA protein
MRLKVPFLRYALAGFAFLLPTAILAAVLPFLINSQPIKAKLVREIASWTGGEVKVDGAISVEDFFSLSVEAQNVEIGRFKDIASIEGMKARRVIAHLAWTDLLLGNFQFEKIKIYDAVFRVREARLADLPQLFSDLVSGTQTRSFAALHLDDSIIALRSGKRRAYRRLEVKDALARSARSGRQLLASAQLRWKGKNARVSLLSGFHVQPGARLPLRIQIVSEPITAHFKGDALLSGAVAATGEMGLQIPNLARTAKWLDLGRGMFAGSVAASGEVNIASDTAALTSGEIALAGQTAQTALTLKRDKDQPRLEGALAFDRLDVNALVSGTGSERFADGSLLGALIESDLRISAKEIVWDGIALGDTALALTSAPQRLSAEIAELDFLGGEVRGQVAFDADGPLTRATARLSAESVDAAAFLRLAKQRDWLTGFADVNVEAEAAWADPTSIVDQISARARVNFPEGGQMRLDIPRLASLAPSEGDEGWGSFEFSNAAFDKLRFEMTLRAGQINFADVLLASAGRRVNGDGEIDLAQRSLDWRFTFVPGAVPQKDHNDAPDVPGSANLSRLSIKGPWIRPVIRSGDSADRSMLEKAQRAAVALELYRTER